MAGQHRAMWALASAGQDPALGEQINFVKEWGQLK
jgi:hypothetical protein